MKYSPKTVYSTTVKVISQQLTPYIGISTRALSQMKHYVEGCVDEIGWFFTVQQDTQNKRVLYVKECLLFPQEVHATTTEINGERLTQFATELLSQEGGMDLWNELRGWGHSHVNMGVTPSGQDDTQMEFFARAGQPFFVRCIANKKGDIKFDLYDYESGVAFIDVPWIEIPMNAEQKEIMKQIKELQARLDAQREAEEKELKETIEKEIKEKVKKFVSHSNIYSKTYGQGAVGSENFQGATSGGTKTGTSTNKDEENLYSRSRIALTESNLFTFFEYMDLLEIGYLATRIEQVRYIEKMYPENLFTQHELQIILESANYYAKINKKALARETTATKRNNKKEKDDDEYVIHGGKVIKIGD